MPSLRRFLGMVVCSLALAEGAGSGAINQAAAARCFEEARALGAREGGRLWGKPLNGPMLFVDPVTRTAVANEGDAQGALHRSEGVFAGRLPDAVPIANTATEWSGTRWTMVLWPLPVERHVREKLMMHECFHRIQKELGLALSDRPCAHLDTKEGRIWLQLEWRALGEALLAQGGARRRAIQDALLFRAHRRKLFPGAAEAERDMELNEGLAEYTGIRSSARSTAQALTDALVGLEAGARKPTFVRSFAYASGPAYGLLLEASAPQWRQRVKDRPDLGDLLRQAHGIRHSANLEREALRRADHYGAQDLIQDEARREEVQKARLAHFQSRLVDAPVLSLPRTEKFNYSFNPNQLVPLGDLGMVYPTLTASGPWGTLELTGGALMTPQDLRIPAPENPSARPLKGDGWTLNLAPGWIVSPGPRTGDHRLVKEAAEPPKPGSGDLVK
jgi:hypothetical protein